MSPAEVVVLLVVGGVALLALLAVSAYQVFGYATRRPERTQLTLRSQRLPGGPCIKCRLAPAVPPHLWCGPCHDFIHGHGLACNRCSVLPQVDGRPWCVRCALEIDEFDKTDPRGLDDK